MYGLDLKKAQGEGERIGTINFGCHAGSFHFFSFSFLEHEMLFAASSFVPTVHTHVYINI